MSGVIGCPACATRNRVPVAAAGAPHCARCGADLPWLAAAGDADFAAAVDTPLLVLVDLWAPWCGPCRTIAPAVERAAQVLAGRLKVVKVNVDEAPGVAARFGVRGIPTLLLLRDGRVADRQTGALPDQALLAWVQGQLAAGAPPRT